LAYLPKNTADYLISVMNFAVVYMYMVVQKWMHGIAR